MATDRPGRADTAPDSAPSPADARPDDRRLDDRQLDDEQRSRGEAYADLRRADRPPATGDDPHATTDGGWTWKSLRLTPADNRVADQQLAARRNAEGRRPDGSYDERGITPALRRIEGQLDHGSLVPDTEKFALKGPDRFKEKLAKLTGRYPDRNTSQLASAIHDGIRYTFIFDTPDYVASVGAAEEKLAAAGYRLQLRKPSWDDPDYKGVNSRWQDPRTNERFEVQFHTPESWEAKQATHEIYEKLADPRTAPQQRARLEDEQQKITARITIPEGATSIAHYRAEDSDD